VLVYRLFIEIYTVATLHLMYLGLQSYTTLMYT
jgi:hypothetical protein